MIKGKQNKFIINFISEGTLAVAIAVSSDMAKVAIISVDDKNFDLYLNYWEGGEKTVKKISNICSKLKVAMSIEVSMDDNYIFLAGASSFNMKRSKPVISALQFNSTLEEVNYLELYDEKMRMVNQIRRLPNTETLLVSGFKVISVVEFRNFGFIELKQLRNIHSGNIYSFCLRGRDVFSVCPDDNFIHKF